MGNLALEIEKFEKEYPKKYLALYQALKFAICSGRIKHGQYLPSTRELAKSYGWSRGTITLAFEMLWADSYLVTDRGKGTRVNYQGQNQKRTEKVNSSFKLSKWGKRLSRSEVISKIPEKQKTHFFLGYQDQENFPALEWQACARKAMKETKLLLSEDQSPAEGLWSLRESISKHLQRSQGLGVSADEIVIVNGASQAIGLLIRLLLDEGESLVIEDPTFRGILDLGRTSNISLIPAKVDKLGIQIKDWDSKLAFVTPSHQFPSGIVLDRDRRIQLLEWAKKRNAFIIEDYIDGEFRRKGRPIEPLKLLDHSDRVIYLGSFSRTLSRNLRLGFVVLPKSIKSFFIEAKKYYEPFSSSNFEQQALGYFIKNGEYEKHIRRMSRIYNRKHSVFMETFNKYLPTAFNWNDSDVGLYLFGNWNGTEATLNLFKNKCAEKGLFWQDPKINYIKSYKPAAIFGFSHLSESKIKLAIQQMGEIYDGLF